MGASGTSGAVIPSSLHALHEAHRDDTSRLRCRRIMCITASVPTRMPGGALVKRSAAGRCRSRSVARMSIATIHAASRRRRVTHAMRHTQAGATGDHRNQQPVPRSSPAHHARDQAETVLLQYCGELAPAGLAAMPANDGDPVFASCRWRFPQLRLRPTRRDASPMD